MRRSLRLIGNLILMVILFAILFTFAMFQGGFVSWFLFFSFLPIFLYHLGLLLYPMKRWHVTRRLSDNNVRAGGKVSVTIQITRKIPFPLYYCIVEEIFPDSLMDIYYRDKYKYVNETEIPTFARRLKKILFPWFKRHITIPYELNRLPRGDHTLNAIRVRTGDIFGFIKKEYTFPVKHQFVTYPSSYELQIKEQLSSFEQGTTTSFSPQMSQSNVVSGVREYVPGDKFSQIDWKQTARKNEMMTKEFEQERSTDTVLIFDACAFEGINVLDFEGAIEMVLSLLNTLQSQGANVGVLSIGNDVIHFPTHKDQKKLEWVRQHLTHIRPARERVFSVALDQETDIFNNRPIVMVVTIHIDDPVRQSLKKLRQRMGTIVVILVRSTVISRPNEDGIIDQLRYDGFSVCILTERELMKSKIEVDI